MGKAYPRVRPAGGPSTYTWDANDRPIDMIDSDALMERCEPAFQANASLAEGVAGQCGIDTTYENTREFMVEMPRSDQMDDPSIARPFNNPNPWNDRYAAPAPNHEGVGNPAPECLESGLYPHRRY